MESVKLFDSELKLMQLLWQENPISAKEISLKAKDVLGWNKNTTYTVITKLIEKKVIERSEPNFICTPSITEEQVQRSETKQLIEKLFNGSKKAFFSSLIHEETLSEEDIAELRKLIEGGRE